MSFIDSRFGTWRGAVRLGLCYAERLSGQAAIRAAGPAPVERIVFVCQGNICRSAFAEGLARDRGLPVASFGLATTTGVRADPAAARAALALGVDLDRHRTTARSDFVVRPGDLLLAMETRQLRKIAADADLAPLQRNLLGSWARPSVPHLHDPFQLSDAYFLTCFRRIQSAVERLADDFSDLRA